MDKKIQPAYMLSTRDPTQNKWSTQSEREGMEKIFQANGHEKESWGSNTYIRQNTFQNKGHKRDNEGHFIILTGTVQQEDITFIKIYAPNIETPKHIKKILEDFKKDIDNNTAIIGDFNTPLSEMDRSSKQRINKDVVALNYTLD